MRSCLLWVCLVLPACTVPEEPKAAGCRQRTAFYPDADGDGIGEATDVYIGCEAPEGWVSVLGAPSDTGETDDTGDTGDSGTA